MGYHRSRFAGILSHVANRRGSAEIQSRDYFKAFISLLGYQALGEIRRAAFALIITALVCVGAYAGILWLVRAH